MALPVTPCPRPQTLLRTAEQRAMLPAEAKVSSRTDDFTWNMVGYLNNISFSSFLLVDVFVVFLFQIVLISPLNID